MTPFDGIPLGQLTCDRIIQTLTESSLSEGLFVDFKADFPANLAKYIASFANARGGYIFIGVAEDPIRKTAATFPGVEIQGDLSERVRNITRAHLSPFPAIEASTYQLPNDNSRGIVVIHVWESACPPHVCSDGRIFIRNGDASDPVEPVKDRFTIDRLFDKADGFRNEFTVRRGRLLAYGRTKDQLLPHRGVGIPTTIAFCSLCYPQEYHLLGGHRLNCDVLRDQVGRLAYGPSGIRTVPQGLALVLNAGNTNYADKATWWASPCSAIAYDDGFFERCTRQAGNEAVVDVQHACSAVVDDAISQLDVLHERLGYDGGMVCKVIIYGCMTRRFRNHQGHASRECDSNMVEVSEGVPRTFRGLDAGERQQMRTDTIVSLITKLIDGAGGIP